MLHGSKERASPEDADIFMVFLLDGTSLGRLPCKAATPVEYLSKPVPRLRTGLTAPRVRLA
jgi:hypothetical protein